MKKSEIITLSVILLFYIKKVVGFEMTGFAAINLFGALYISIAGFHLYKFPNSEKRVFSKLFPILFGIAFGAGLLSIAAKVWHHYNYIVLSFASPNIIMLALLIWQFRKSKRRSQQDETKYFKGLIIRSSIIACLSITFVFLSIYTIDKHINRDEPRMYNRALARDFYEKSLELSEKNKYEDALFNANQSLLCCQIGYEDSSDFTWIYEAHVDAYFGLIKKEYHAGNIEKVTDYLKQIQKPIKYSYGDTSSKAAAVCLYAAKVYEDAGKFDISDSLFKRTLHIFKGVYGFKNIMYALTLEGLADSYREQGYFRDAIDLFPNILKYMKNDTMDYITNGTPTDNGKFKDNSISFAYADWGYTYSLVLEYDSADVCFEKAFANKLFNLSDKYPVAISNFAQHNLNKGDYNKAKSLFEEEVRISKEAHGIDSYAYLDALYDLNSVNITLALYSEAEKGCNEAIEIHKKLSDKKDDNYYRYCVEQLAETKYHQGSYDSAEVFFNEALSYTPKETKNYASILVSLSRLNAELTRYPKANEFAMNATELAQSIYKRNNSRKMIEYYGNEAYINYLIGNTDKAEGLYLQCYSIDTLNKSQKNMTFSETLNGIGLIKTRKKKYDQADTLFDASLKIIEKQLGKIHPNYATTLYNKAYLRVDQGKVDEAEKLFNESLSINLKVLGNTHDKVADDYVGLGELKLKKADYSGALDYFMKASTIYKAKFKSEHEKVKLTNNYVEMCKARKI